MSSAVVGNCKWCTFRNNLSKPFIIDFLTFLSYSHYAKTEIRYCNDIKCKRSVRSISYDFFVLR